jgi:hypothetical protein
MLSLATSPQVADDHAQSNPHLQFLGLMRDGWSLEAKHFGKQALHDLQDVVVAESPRPYH